jgi:3-oxoacyl-(acyl-carrier-protein) synthase
VKLNQSKTFLLDYECSTAAGLGVQALMNGLVDGKDFSQTATEAQFSRPIVEGGRVCFIPHQDLVGRSYLQTFNKQFKAVYGLMQSRWTEKQKAWLQTKKILCIFSSTKGLLEDYIGNANAEQIHSRSPFDSLSNIVSDQFKNPHLQFITISNACSSSHVAIEWAHKNLSYGQFDFVFVIAFDFIGPFIYNGFNALKVLSTSQNTPFAKNRDGLQLGEAFSILLFSNESSEDLSAGIIVSDCASQVVPASVTRPTLSGESLMNVMNQVSQQANQDSKNKPDLFLAHGTGTLFNDRSEDAAIFSYQQQHQINSPITGTKWSVGHCLGASGALDLIAAAEIILKNKIFSLKNSEPIDPGLLNSSFILTNNYNEHFSKPYNSVMITSLGFGGIYSAIQMKKAL